MPQVLVFFSGFLEDTDKHIEVAEGRHFTAKKGQLQITMCDNNGDTFIATLHNVLLAPNLCNRLFSIITFMDLGHTCLFHKGFWTVFFGAKEKNAVILPHSAHRKHAFWGEIKQMSKTKKLPSKKRICLELLHQILVTNPPDRCWLGILLMSGRIFNLG